MCASKLHLWVEEPITDGDFVTLSAVIERPTRGRQKLWYKIPSEHSGLVSDSCDPFLIGNIFLIMTEGADCVFHGSLSPSVLRNLAEFQSAWSAWRPEKYRQVDISAEREMEECVADPPGPALAAFSGGVDSTFTVFRHTTGKCPNAWKRQIEACLFVKGFDIPLDHDDAFQRAFSKIQTTLSQVGVKVITMSTNLQALNVEWDDTHVAGLASTLMLFKRRYSEGLIASGCAYSRLVIPWGSNPITDHLLSSSSFRIVHDGAGIKRLEKIKRLPAWQEGYDSLRVCFSAEKRDENCGVCAKCVMDILLMRIEGITQPASYPELTDSRLAKLEIPTPHQFVGFGQVVSKARQDGIREPWVEILSKRIDEVKRQQKTNTWSVANLEKLFSRLMKA